MLVVSEITAIFLSYVAKSFSSILDVDLEIHCRDLITLLFKDQICLLYL